MLVQDHFCQQQALLAFMADESNWRAAAGKYHWWPGWWERPASNPWEEFIALVWQSQGVENRVAGFEYWCNCLDSSAGLNHLSWHQDKDEVRFRTRQELSCPEVGTVFYGNPHQLQGGYLEISADETGSELERIKPVFNRLVIFDVSEMHRVTRVYSGERFSLQINLWVEKPLTFADGDVVSVEV